MSAVILTVTRCGVVGYLAAAGQSFIVLHLLYSPVMDEEDMRQNARLGYSVQMEPFKNMTLM